MEDEMEAEHYRQPMENQQEMDQYRQLQNPAAMSPPGMLEDPLSPFYAEEPALSPPRLSREEAMLDLAAPAPSGLDLLRSARNEPEYPRHMGFIDNMLGGFEQMPFDMGIMDRDFDLFGPPPTSGVGADSLFADAYPSIELAPPDPMAAFYGEPRQFPPRTPRCRRGRSVTSGVRLPPGASGNMQVPKNRFLHDHLMGTPEANMLLGARPLPELRGTPMPPLFDDPPLPEGRRNSRY